jgi:pectate lyase
MRAIAMSKKITFLVALVICLGSSFAAGAFTGYHDTLLTKEAVGALNMPDIIAPVKAPFPMPQFKKPVFNSLTIPITKKGAKPGSLVTKAIQSAIDEVNRRGGGTVVVPPGIWKTGRIILKSNVNLNIPEGAELHFSGEINDYLPVVFTRSAGVEVMSLGACIYANGQQNIAITGKGKLLGLAEGSVRKQQIGYGSFENEFPFDKAVPERIYDGKNGSPVFSPTFIGPVNCKDVYIEGISLERTAFWNIVPTYCDGVIIRGVTVNSVGTPMGDGMDIESCRNVLIEYCTLSTGDDCYTIKAGRGVDGIRVNKPCENIVVRYSLAKEGHGGITCGSETAGMIRNLYVHDCVFDGTNIGIRFKTRRPRGGGGENLYYERIRMNLTGAAFRVDMLGSSQYVGELATRNKRAVDKLTPLYRNIVAKEIIVEQASEFLSISALPESPLTNFLIENADVSSKKLISITDASGVTLKNIRVRSTDSLIQIIDAKNINFDNVQFNGPVNEVATKNEGN